MGAPKLVLAPGTIYPRYVSGRSRFGGTKGPPKQVWRSRVRTWHLLKANALYWRKYLWHCWEFTANPAVIRCPQQLFGAPIVIRRPGICAPVAVPASRPWYHPDLLQNHGLHCRGITRGERGTIPRAPNHYPGRRKSQQYHMCFLQCNTFASERPQFRTWGRQSCFMPRAPSNLAAPRLHWQHMPKTGFWLCKLPESCASCKFSIAFLFSLLLFLSKLPSTIVNELVKKYIFTAQRQVQNCANESDRVCNCWTVLLRYRNKRTVVLLRKNSIVDPSDKRLGQSPACESWSSTKCKALFV